jgi:hypothetical protein
MGLVVQEKRAWTMGGSEGFGQPRESITHPIGRGPRCERLGLERDAGDRYTRGPKEPCAANDGSFDGADESTPASKCIDILLECVRQQLVVAVSFPKFTFQCQPPSGFGPGGSSLHENGLPRSPQAGDSPVRVKRMGVGDERVELGERSLPPREIRGQDAVARPKWVLRLFVRHETDS